LRKSSGATPFGVVDSADEHVQVATKNPVQSLNSVTSVVSPKHELLTKMSNMDLEVPEINENLTLGSDLESSHVVSDITQVGHAKSTEGSVPLSETHNQEVALPSAIKSCQAGKLVKELQRLKEAAANNSKLQQFLVDRAHVIDMLDGDISEKCQDVNLLKESLKQAVSPCSQTSSMLVPSTTSSLTNEIDEPADSHVDYVVLRKSSGATPFGVFTVTPIELAKMRRKRGLALGIALTVYEREEEAHTLIEQMTRDQDPILRCGEGLRFLPFDCLVLRTRAG
nr:26S proteasome non-ATPase regulatory subunit 1 -like protein A [Tanacetum cinerariifolium]